MELEYADDLQSNDFKDELQSTGSGTDDEIPSDHPLKWSWRRKHLILIQIAFFATGGGFNSAIIIPGVFELAKQFNNAVVADTYIISVPVLFLGAGPFLWIPLSNAYGRRPVLIGSMLLSCVSSLGGGYATSYGTLMVARIFQAIGISYGFVVGSAVVVDMFWQHERGQKTGIWVLMLTLGAPLGALIGGPLVQNCGWQWAMWLPACTNGAQALAFFLTYRETLYPARQLLPPNLSHFTELFRLPRRVPHSSLSLKTFLAPLLFIQSPIVVLCALAYGLSFGEASVGMANIVPLAFGEVYSFNATADGLVFIAVLIGVFIGEQLSGPLSDYIMHRHVKAQKALGQPIKLEHRLRAALPGYILLPIGLVIFGTTLRYKTHWIGPCFGLGVANGALQIVSTVLSTYCIDCYSGKALMVTQYVSLVRQVISFTVPFWNPPLNAKVGYAWGFGIEALMLVFFYVLSLLVYWRGKALRERFPIRGL